MGNQTIDETCACGAKFRWQGEFTSSGSPLVVKWRADHRHDMPTRPDYSAENAAVFKHEAETPMRAHDADGRCCLMARLAPAHPQEPTDLAPEEA